MSCKNQLGKVRLGPNCPPLQRLNERQLSANPFAPPNGGYAGGCRPASGLSERGICQVVQMKPDSLEMTPFRVNGRSVRSPISSSRAATHSSARSRRRLGRLWMIGFKRQLVDSRPLGCGLIVNSQGHRLVSVGLTVTTSRMMMGSYERERSDELKAHP